ncbi:hypothetical protein OLP53_09960, partial [Campylobacter jejuni]|nr:hypothetical protein [Campylobacter jejuni]
MKYFMGGYINNSYKEWKMSRISLENYLQVHNRYSCFSNDIYLNKKYAELYGETFDFSYSKNGL